MKTAQMARWTAGFPKKLLGLAIATTLVALSPGPGFYHAWAQFQGNAPRPASPVPPQPVLAQVGRAILNVLETAVTYAGSGPHVILADEAAAPPDAGWPTERYLRARPTSLPQSIDQSLRVISPDNQAKLVQFLHYTASHPRPGDGNPGELWRPGSSAGGLVHETASASDLQRGQEALSVLQSLNAVLDGVTLEDLRNEEILHAALGRVWEHVRSWSGHAPDLDASRPIEAAVPGTELLPPGSASSDRTNAGALRVPAPRPSAASGALNGKDAQAYWAAYQEEILEQIGPLRQKLEAFAEERLKIARAAAFADEVELDKIKVEIKGLGRAELKGIDQTSFIRIVHEPTGIALLFVNREAVSKDSRHLRQIVARQHMEAGPNQKGRDAALLWENSRGERIAGAGEFRPKPRFGRQPRAWLSAYWRAKYQKPTRAEKIAGITTALAQTLLSIPLELARMHHDPGSHFNVFPTLWTTFMGLLLGNYHKTYQNFVMTGSPTARFLKNAAISLVFAIPVTIAVFGADAANPFNPFGIVHLGYVAANIALNTLGKIAWQEYIAIGRDQRIFKDPIRLRLGEKTVALDRATLYFQTLYTVSWSFRYMDLVASFGIWPSKIALILSVVLSRWGVVRWVEKRRFAQAPRARQRWDRDKKWLLFVLIGLAVLQNLK
ncbi:MAG: hypothetical protein HY551_01935 [Elusimicrobia bacterium]|nr:hypothetical protein [Elusimicrobiota bacterium]